MYEEQTFESVLQRMLDQVTGDIDKREGSLIYDALAPAAVELAQAYIELNAALDLGFAGTSSGQYLEMRTQELGVYRQEATKAVREATFNMAPGQGARFYVDDLYFEVIQDGTTAQVECTTAGTVGNDPLPGIDLLPMEIIVGLSSAQLGEVIIPGAAAETDAELLERYLLEIARQATSGNIYHYHKWAREVPGVGGVCVEPRWAGPSTIRLFIMDSEKKPASPELVAQVQEYIDPLKGQGEGKAPVDHFVTVAPATQREIDIEVTIEIDDEYTSGQVLAVFEEKVTEHFKEIAFDSDPAVRHSRIAYYLFETPGVLDYMNLTLNGAEQKIVVEPGEIAVLGQVTLHVN